MSWWSIITKGDLKAIVHVLKLASTRSLSIFSILRALEECIPNQRHCLLLEKILLLMEKMLPDADWSQRVDFVRQVP
jgi:hypothetical protein